MNKNISIKSSQLTYATGLVSPKTTTLFFDKIWVPSYINEFTAMLLGIDISIPQKYLLQVDVQEDELITVFFDRNSPYRLPKGDAEIIEYLTSNNRNEGIFRSSKAFWDHHKMIVTPVYFNFTSFETANDIHNNYNKHHGLPTEGNQFAALSCCIANIPEIVEKELTWQQVSEIKEDRESLKKLRRFKNWMYDIGDSKSEIALTEYLQQVLDDYKSALNKHGILTSVGAMTTIITGGSTIYKALVSDTKSLLMTGIVVTGGVIAYTVTQTINLLEVRHNPVAFLYDLVQRT